MSVILSACRNAKQRANAQALKKRKEKRKLKKELLLQELETRALTAVAKMWLFKIESEYYCIVLHLTSDKYKMDIFCNDEEIIDVMINNDGNTATFDFLVGTSHKSRITRFDKQGQGPVYTLTIDGYNVPECQEEKSRN